MGNKLFLFIFDCHLQPLEGLPFSRLPILARWIEVQHDFKLIARASVVQQRRRELLGAFSHNVVVSPELGLHATESP